MARSDFDTEPLGAAIVQAAACARAATRAAACARAATRAAAAPAAETRFLPALAAEIRTAAAPAAETRTLPAPAREDQAGALGPEFEMLYSVVLIDDDEHTYQYVITMLCTLFDAGVEMAYLMARAVDTDGRVVVCTAGRDMACRKRDAIKAFGPDPLLAHSTRSMHAVIEPVQGR